MKYIFFAYGDEQRLATLPKSELDELEQDCIANDDVLTQSGHLLSVEGLHGRDSAATVRLQDGSVLISDGPFAETKEQILGIFLINARDLNEALQIASHMPQLRGGPIEVRPLVDA